MFLTILFVTTVILYNGLSSGIINPIPPGLFEGGAAWGGGGGGVPAAYNSKAINDNEIKLGGIVKDH